MVLTAAEKRARNAAYQARWRAKRDALVKDHPDVVERALIAAAEACLSFSHGTKNPVSDQERIALADKLADLAMVHLRRSQELAAMAMKVRAGEW